MCNHGPISKYYIKIKRERTILFPTLLLLLLCKLLNDFFFVAIYEYNITINCKCYLCSQCFHTPTHTYTYTHTWNN